MKQRHDQKEAWKMPSPSLSSPVHVQLPGFGPSEQINDGWRIICVSCSPILCCQSLVMLFNGMLTARHSLGTTASSFQLFQSLPRARSDIPRALQLGNSSKLLREPDVTRFFSLISRAVVWMCFKLLSAFSEWGCCLGFGFLVFLLSLGCPFPSAGAVLCNPCPFPDTSVKNAEIS